MLKMPLYYPSSHDWVIASFYVTVYLLIMSRVKKYVYTWVNNIIAILKQTNILSVLSLYKLLIGYNYPHYP